MLKQLTFALTLIVLSQFTYGAEAKVVRVLSYYEIPPFKISDTQGLSFDLVAQLNAASSPALQFTIYTSSLTS